MSKVNYKCKSAIAKFLVFVPSANGWWYRMPTLNDNQTKMSKKIHFNENNYHDNIMPHFGTVFGISEDGIAIILAEIGCLTLQKSGRTTVRKKGWEDLAREFDLKEILEVEMTRLGGKKISLSDSGKQRAILF